MPSPVPTPAWQALADHHRAAAGSHLRNLLADDGRSDALTFTLDGLFLDLSKNRLTETTLALLLDLAARKIKTNTSIGVTPALASSSR